MANASGIQDAKGPISLRSALLRVQRTIGGATQRPICLQGKSGTGKASGKRRTCPLGRSILNLRRLLFRARRLDGGRRLDNHCWGKFRCAQLRGGELLPEFQEPRSTPTGRGSGKTPDHTGYGSTIGPRLAPHLQRLAPSQTSRDASTDQAHLSR